MQPEDQLVLPAQPRVPVISDDGHPLIPCRPKRARVLLRDGRAEKTWVNGNFAIRMNDRTRDESEVPEMTLGITPGSKTTGFAITLDQDETQERRVVHAIELELIGHRISKDLRKRANHRGNRRSRLRFRQPRFSNRRKPKGSLPPSIQHNLDQIDKWTRTLIQLYPISNIRVSTSRFDIQLMENPGIQGEEHQQGTLYGWQLRTYVFHQNGHRCFYCGEQGKPLTLDHIIPKSRGGTDRVANLTTACLKCNQLKDNDLPEEFLADRPDKLRELLAPNPRRSYRDATWMNTIMPFLIGRLKELGNPVEQTNSALTGWNRKQMQLPKTHYIDAAVLGDCRSLLESSPVLRQGTANRRGHRSRCLSEGMPELVAHVKPSNGRSKQKANVDANGTIAGKPFRRYCRLGPRERSRTPTPGHAGKRTHFGPELIATGDIVTIQHKKLGAITGRAVMTNYGKSVKIRGENGKPSGPTRTARLVRRNPGYTKKMVQPESTR